LPQEESNLFDIASASKKWHPHVIGGCHFLFS
jgi:hypothetical protein